MDLEQAKEWAHRAEPAEVFISSHPRRTQNALWALVAEVDRLTAANSDLQQRLDAAEEERAADRDLMLRLQLAYEAKRDALTAAEEALKVAQGEVAEADRRAGCAERKEASTADTLHRLTSWRDLQKVQAGYDRSVSFDLVWAETLTKAESLTAANSRVGRLREALEDTFDPFQHRVACQKRRMEKCMCAACIKERAQKALADGKGAHE